MATKKLHTPKFRVAFPDVFEATQINGQGAEKYRLTMIFDPKEIAKDPAEQKRFDALRAAIRDTAEDKFGVVPKVMKEPFKKGDDMRNKETGAIYDGHEGMVILRSQSNERPGLVDGNLNPILERSDFYGGCYARATVNFYGWEHPTQGKGVSCGIQNIQKVADGEALFSGKTKAEDDFEAIESPAGSSDLFDE